MVERPSVRGGGGQVQWQIKGTNTRQCHLCSTDIDVADKAASLTLRAFVQIIKYYI